MSNARQIAEGDKVSYRRLPFKVATVWGGFSAGQVTISEVAASPSARLRYGSFNINADRLVWSDIRGCWVVVKPEAK